MTLDDFHALQDAARAGRYSSLKHFRQRARLRGFTVEYALEVLTADDAQAWRIAPRAWLVVDPIDTDDSGHRLHLSVKLTRRGEHALLLTGWLAHHERTLRRLAGREEVTPAA